MLHTQSFTSMWSGFRAPSSDPHRYRFFCSLYFRTSLLNTERLFSFCVLCNWAMTRFERMWPVSSKQWAKLNDLTCSHVVLHSFSEVDVFVLSCLHPPAASGRLHTFDLPHLWRGHQWSFELKTCSWRSWERVKIQHGWKGESGELSDLQDSGRSVNLFQVLIVDNKTKKISQT